MFGKEPLSGSSYDWGEAFLGEAISGEKPFSKSKSTTHEHIQTLDMCAHAKLKCG